MATNPDVNNSVRLHTEPSCEGLFWSVMTLLWLGAASLAFPTMGLMPLALAVAFLFLVVYLAILVVGFVVSYGPFVLPPMVVIYLIYHRGSFWVDNDLRRRHEGGITDRADAWIVLVLGATCFTVVVFLAERFLLCKVYEHYDLGNWMICDLPNGDPFLKILYDLIGFEYYQPTDGRPNYYRWRLDSSAYPIANAVLTRVFR